MSDRPLSVRRYSTFGGVSGRTVRVMSPSASSARRFSESTFCEMGSPFAKLENEPTSSK